MKVNVPLHTVDIIILVIIGIMMIGGIKIVRGFFHEGKHTVQKSTYNGKGKVKIIVAVDGMQCGHCEANINDAIHNHFNVIKVSSSHTKGQVTIIANQDLDTDQIQNVINESGYQYIGITKYNM